MSSSVTMYGSSHPRNLFDFTLDPPTARPDVAADFGVQADMTYIVRGGMKIPECLHLLESFTRVNRQADLTCFIIGSNDMSRFRRDPHPAAACSEELFQLCSRALELTTGAVVIFGLLPRIDEKYNKWACEVNELLERRIQHFQGQRLHFRPQRLPLRLGPTKIKPSRHLISSRDDVHLSNRGNSLLYSAVRGAIATHT